MADRRTVVAGQERGSGSSMHCLLTPTAKDLPDRPSLGDKRTCRCGLPTVRKVAIAAPHAGRMFDTCDQRNCGYFSWATTLEPDEPAEPKDSLPPTVHRRGGLISPSITPPTYRRPSSSRVKEYVRQLFQGEASSSERKISSESGGMASASFRYDPNGDLLLGDEPIHLDKKPNPPDPDTESDSLEEGTLSPWWEEGSPAAGISSAISPSVRAWFLGLLLDEFSAFKNNSRLVCQDSRSSQTQHSSAKAIPNPQAAKHLGGLSVNKGPKRKRDDEEGEEQNGRSRIKAPLNIGEDESNRLLACPFCKWKPLTYRQCRTKILKEIARVKMHLWRCHQIPTHCVICFAEFGSTAERDAHLRQRSCELSEPKKWEGITEEQKEKLKRRVNTKKTKGEQWYEIYAILFPNQPLPDSPYVEGLLSDELIALQEFMAQEWPSIFERHIQERLPETLRSQEDVVRAFSNSVFESAVAEIFESFEASRRRPRSATDSAYHSHSLDASDSDMGNGGSASITEPNSTPEPPGNELQSMPHAREQPGGHGTSLQGWPPTFEIYINEIDSLDTMDLPADPLMEYNINNLLGDSEEPSLFSGSFLK